MRSRSRREFLILGAGAISAAAILAACGDDDDDEDSETLPRPQNADEALSRLREGNARYAEFKATRPDQSSERRAEVAEGQEPWAVIWGCIDSRVPPEILFDEGLGDFFV